MKQRFSPGQAQPECLQLNSTSLLKLALALGVSLGSGLANAGSNPVGNYGSHNSWQTSYSEAFFSCLDRDPKTTKILLDLFESKQLADVGAGKAWCPSADLSSDANVKLFLLAMLEALAEKESNYNPLITAQGPYGTVVGLFQIGENDAKLHKCKAISGEPINSQASLQNPANNICCALQTIAWEATQNSGVNHHILATGNGGIMGAFWQPLQSRTSAVKSAEIKTKVRHACNAIANNSPTLDFTAREIASAGGSAVKSVAGVQLDFTGASSAYIVASEWVDTERYSDIEQ